MKSILMADQDVGLEITQWLLSDYKQDIALVVTSSENEILEVVRQAKVPSLVFESTNQVHNYIQKSGIDLDIGFLVWWPKLIKHPLLKLPKQGFINTHPSLLPFNRGKHYNFWALVEQAPFGVSLHFAEDGIDNGNIVAQATIPYGWEDNGAALYKKAKYEIVNLFKETYPTIRTLNIPQQKQDLDRGSFHLADEIERASLINLDDSYRARDLLNLLRARTFVGYPACWFNDGINEYEVRVEITRKLQ